MINHDVPQFDSVCWFIVFPLLDSSKNCDPPDFTQQFWVFENSNEDHIPNSHGFGEHGQVAFGWIYQFIEITQPKIHCKGVVKRESVLEDKHILKYFRCHLWIFNDTYIYIYMIK